LKEALRRLLKQRAAASQNSLEPGHAGMDADDLMSGICTTYFHRKFLLG
jgi:hypothetical protein